MAANDRIQTYNEFWPFYLKEHSKKKTRDWHFAGSTLSVMFLIASLLLGRPGLLIAALVAGYGFAWFSHFMIQKNRPATFKYPFWSLYSDFRMWFLQLTGQFSKELIKHSISE